MSVPAWPAPLARWRKGAQNDDEVDTHCDVSGKHAYEDQKPGEKNDAKQHNETVRSSMEYHHTSHRSELVGVARLIRCCEGEGTRLPYITLKHIKYNRSQREGKFLWRYHHNVIALAEPLLADSMVAVRAVTWGVEWASGKAAQANITVLVHASVMTIQRCLDLDQQARRWTWFRFETC